MSDPLIFGLSVYDLTVLGGLAGSAILYIEKRALTILRELRSSDKGGKSMREAVDQINSNTKDLNRKLVEIDAEVKSLDVRVVRLESLNGSENLRALD